MTDFSQSLMDLDARSAEFETNPLPLAEHPPTIDDTSAQWLATVEASDESDGLSNGIRAYLQRIAQTPLLTRTQEVELFRQFVCTRQQVTECLNQLPPVILERLQSNNVPKRLPPSPQASWWQPLELPSLLGQIRRELDAYPATADNPTGNGRPVSCPRLNQLWCD